MWIRVQSPGYIIIIVKLHFTLVTRVPSSAVDSQVALIQEGRVPFIITHMVFNITREVLVVFCATPKVRQYMQNDGMVLASVIHLTMRFRWLFMMATLSSLWTVVMIMEKERWL